MKKLLALVTLSLFSVSCSAITLTIRNTTGNTVNVTVEMTAQNKEDNQPNDFELKHTHSKTIDYKNKNVTKIKLHAKEKDNPKVDASITITPDLFKSTIDRDKKLVVEPRKLFSGIRFNYKE